MCLNPAAPTTYDQQYRQNIDRVMCTSEFPCPVREEWGIFDRNLRKYGRTKFPTVTEMLAYQEQGSEVDLIPMVTVDQGSYDTYLAWYMSGVSKKLSAGNIWIISNLELINDFEVSFGCQGFCTKSLFYF